MECNEDEKTSDFFKAFLHSLRASCFQFIDFRDNVSIRGFLAVDVDSDTQQHYVLSEIVSRGKNSGMCSFPLEVVTSSKSLDHDLTSCPEKSPKHLSLSEDTDNRHSRKSSRSSVMLPNKLNQKKHVSNTVKHASNRGTPVDGKPPRPYVFQSVRSDPSNSTFIMEQGARPQTGNKASSSSTSERENALKPRISNTTIDVSPRLSLLQRRPAMSAGGASNNTTSDSKRNRKLTHCIRKHEDNSLSSRSPARKRPYKSASVSSISSTDVPTVFDSGSSCEDNSAYTERHSKRSEHKIKKCRRKRDRMKPMNNDISAQHSSRSRGSLRETPYPFNQLFASDSDQDCSITAVKPRYLVGLTDDVNNIVISETKSVNLLSKSPEAKLRRKLFLTEDNIFKYHGSSR